MRRIEDLYRHIYVRVWDYVLCIVRLWLELYCPLCYLGGDEQLLSLNVIKFGLDVSKRIRRCVHAEVIWDPASDLHFK